MKEKISRALGCTVEEIFPAETLLLDDEGEK